ncbi:MAG: hypothetical protein NTW25_08965 [Candidatus Kapabacteria bacterium]|nr:hypothetical protein [Candidatus Kapabacteria bacterium]
MIKTIFYILFISLVIVINSCKQEEVIIDNTNKSYNVLVSVGGGSPKLSIYSFPDGKLVNDNLLGNLNSQIVTSKVTKIAEYLGNLYLIMPSSHKIEVISKADYKQIATYDFTSLQLTPTDICFPNATDAYVAMKDSNLIELIDIHFNKIVKSIKVGNNPSSIAASGNQVYVANQASNNVTVIDLSLNKGVVATIDVAPNPNIIGFTASNDVYVVSIGNGKIDTMAKSVSKITYINPLTRTITSSLDLGYGTTAPALNQIPFDIANSNKTYGYIPTSEALFRVDLKYKDKVKLVTKATYDKVYFYFGNRSVILMKKMNGLTNFSIADEINVLELSNFNINAEVEAILPL